MAIRSRSSSGMTTTLAASGPRRPLASTSIQSGIGRETHKMMLDHYQQTKNVLVSYSPNALGFF